MDYYDAVASQPQELARSAVRVREALASADLGPWRSGGVGVVAMGASTHAGQALVDRFRRHGRAAYNLDASAVMELTSPAVLADSYVFVSEGGRSRETVEAARALPPGARLGLTNAPSSPFADAVDLAVELGHGPDSTVYTVGYTATLQAFSLLATALDGDEDGADLDALPAAVDAALHAVEGQAGAIADRLVALEALDFVGRGTSLAAAAEGALVLREATRTPTAAFETFQYLHGPIEGLDARRGCVVVGTGRECSLASMLADRGIFTVLLTTDPVEPRASLAVLRIDQHAPLARAVLEIVPIQVIAGELARRRGLGIDGFAFPEQDTKIPA